MVYEFQTATVADASKIVDALDKAQSEGFELLNASGMAGQVVLMFRRPKIVTPVQHGPKVKRQPVEA